MFLGFFLTFYQEGTFYRERERQREKDLLFTGSVPKMAATSLGGLAPFHYGIPVW